MTEQSDRYEGGAFSDQFDKGKSSGALTVRADLVRFEADGGAVEMPYGGMSVKLGGTASRLVFFTHAERPGWTVYCPDRSILKHRFLAAHPDLEESLAKISGHERRGRLGWAVATLLIVGLFFGLSWLKDLLVPVVARQIPPSWEQKLGDAAFAAVKAEAKIIHDKQLQEMLEKMVQPLFGAIADKRYPFKLHIVDDETLNAFALPGGNVVLHSGLLLEAGGPGEVLGVLAHEIAHVTQQHSMRQMIQQIGLWVILSSLIGDMSSVMGALAAKSSELVGAKFSRDHERDADDVGWKYLLAGRIDPRGMSDFFVRMRSKRIGSQIAEGALNFLSTHPTTQERLDRLSSRWKTLPRSEREFSVLEMDYGLFKSRLRSLIQHK